MNLFELFVKVGVDDQASGALGKITSGLGNGLKTAAKIGTAAVTAAAAGITALTKSAVDNYAEYEQLVGGVDTLFKNASKKVQQYASEAYRTSGMSANDYMANATAFSASLISSLGGDTEKAAEYANRAMVSMSDNANKMGTSLDSIVQTYQSLSRGNMAMLDNLKLGYGGTKAELERLIADAASYTDIQKEMGITVDASSMSFDNIVNAIAVVQGKLGIAGATAAEAATTIEGSLNSMKASWQNLLTGIADNNADFDMLINNMVESVGAFGENILPRIEVALDGAVKLIEGLFPKIIEALPNLIGTLLPSIVNGALNIVQSFVTAISDNGDLLVQSAIDAVMTLADGILNMLPDIIALGSDLIVAFATSIGEALPTVMPQIVQGILTLIEAFTAPENAEAVSGAAVAIINGLLNGIMGAIPLIVEAVPVIIGNLIDSLNASSSQISSAIAALLPTLISAVISIAVEMLPQLVNSIVATLVENFGSIIGTLIECGGMLIEGLIQGMKEIDIVSVIKSIGQGIVGGVKALFGIHSPSKVFDWIGRMVMAGFQQGIEAGAPDVENAMRGVVGNVIQSAVGSSSGLASALEAALLSGTGVIGENVIDGLYSAYSWFKEGIKGLTYLGEYELIPETKGRGGRRTAQEEATARSKRSMIDRLYETHYHSLDLLKIENRAGASDLEREIQKVAYMGTRQMSSASIGGGGYNLNMTK